VDESTRRILRQWTLAQPVVSAFITSIVRDFSQRDDILQEIAIAVLEHSDRYDEARPFLPWAIGIAQNHIRQFLRRRRNDRLVFGDGVQSLVAASFQDISEQDVDSLDHLRECLSHLDSREQLLCELRYGENLKPAVMAERLGMAANTVSKALQRIRDQLRACIQHKSSMEGGV
jgi:RNA polymerase sigma-70 factor (ECF subfamily)